MDYNSGEFSQDGTLADIEKVSDYHQGQKIHKQLIRLIPVFLAVMIAFFGLQFFPNNLTGFVSMDVDRVQMNEMAFKGSSYVIESNNENPIPMRSAKLTGKVMGTGKVKVFLAHDDQTKLLYTNEPKEVKVSPITGFQIHDGEGNVKSSEFNALLEDVKLSDDGKILAGLQLYYDGYENGIYIERMKITWNPEKDEKLIGIKLNLEDFWGFGKAGSPPSPQGSGTALTGWGQRVPDKVVKPLNAIEFDSDMTDKYIKIEIFYQEYLSGFILGNERYIVAHVYLDSPKDSYIEQDGKKAQKVLYKEDLPGYSGRTEKKKKTTTAKTKEDDDETVSSPGAGQQGEEGEAGGTSIEDSSQESKTEGTDQDTPTQGLTAIDGYIVYKGERPIGTTELEDGRVMTTIVKDESEVNFMAAKDISVKVSVIEDPESKEIFEATEINDDEIEQIISNCEETCFFRDPIRATRYELLFEMDPGTAIDVKSVEFS